MSINLNQRSTYFNQAVVYIETANLFIASSCPAYDTLTEKVMQCWQETENLFESHLISFFQIDLQLDDMFTKSTSSQTFEKMADDLKRYLLYPYLQDKDFYHITSVDKYTHRKSRFSPRWKKKLEEQIENNRGIQLDRFDYKTNYLINKIWNSGVNNITEKQVRDTIGISLAIIVNIPLHYEFLNNVSSSTEIISSVCYDLPLPISISCYVAGEYLACCYPAAKYALPFVYYITQCNKKVAKYVHSYIKDPDPKVRVITYLMKTPNAPDRQLPFYATCIEKGVNWIKKVERYLDGGVNALKGTLSI